MQWGANQVPTILILHWVHYPFIVGPLMRWLSGSFDSYRWWEESHMQDIAGGGDCMDKG